MEETINNNKLLHFEAEIFLFKFEEDAKTEKNKWDNDTK